jgi:hypothetical protein
LLFRLEILIVSSEAFRKSYNRKYITLLIQTDREKVNNENFFSTWLSFSFYPPSSGFSPFEKTGGAARLLPESWRQCALSAPVLPHIYSTG